LVSSLSVKQYFLSGGAWAYLKNIALYMNYNLPGVFGNNIYPNAVNGSLWSLPIEVAMYFILPCFIFLGKKVFKNIPASVILAVLITISATAIKRLFFADARIVFYGTNVGDGLVLAPYFFIGALFTLPALKKLLNMQVAAGLWLITSILNLSDFKIEFLLYGVLSYSVFSIALITNPAYGKWFARNDYSYGIYLYGFLVQQLAIYFLNGQAITYNYYVLISLVVTFVLAFISWYLVEKPAQRLGKRILETGVIKGLKGKASESIRS
jgi:Predicted acyltransferases